MRAPMGYATRRRRRAAQTRRLCSGKRAASPISWFNVDDDSVIVEEVEGRKEGEEAAGAAPTRDEGGAAGRGKAGRRVGPAAGGTYLP